MDPNSIRVLVTFVLGPADGRTEYQAADKVTTGDVTYRGDPGPPPEVKDTPDGLAQVMRPT